MKKLLLPICILLGLAINARAQVDDAQAALRLLKERQDSLRQAVDGAPNATASIRQMLSLGLWSEAAQAIHAAKLTGEDRKLLLAEHAWYQNHFKQAEELVYQVLQDQPNNTFALKLKATLQIEAWQLEAAESTSKELIARDKGDPEASLILGRALLLQKKYTEARQLAAQLQGQFPSLGPAYLLEANAYFWDQHPEQAEPLLVKALELDPFNADARFAYGYAIWRRVDATQLPQMAAQWQLALVINPLHFQTHWHWGNGHTHLTFADYVDPDEDTIRQELAKADTLFVQGHIAEALTVTEKVQKQFSSSVLPAMHKASIYYSDFDSPQRMERLDSAEHHFLRILETKNNYGPAHNGLSAVIKSKRIPYLATYDSIYHSLATAQITDVAAFEKVFPDVAYYPGSIAKAMVWNQLYTSRVYFPFLVKQGNRFVIPPLHQDLAIVMGSPRFRYTTTFDNRQWMDIRGVGSGAAAIEYVERGAYQERNVILHEYVHLFHGRVLTEKENRRIRQLYYGAMANNRTLDYYSQNNESEYFAQTYPAYFEAVKVHPLDFKSMNIQRELIERDPEMYAFIDSLVKKEQRYLDGDTLAMASNWAQVYVNLSNQRGRENGAARSMALLDTALRYDANYLPAHLAYARLHLQQGDPEKALSYLKKTTAIDPRNAPTYMVYAEYVAAADTSLQAIEQQAHYIKKALSLETDYQLRAGNAIALKNHYHDAAQIGKAIEAAESFVAQAPKVSTYLRDRNDDLLAYAAFERALLGDSGQLTVLKRFAAQRPQHYELRAQYADALSHFGHYGESIAQMKEVQRILASNKQGRADFDLRIAESYLLLDSLKASRQYYALALAAVQRLNPALRFRLAQLAIKLGDVGQAEELLAAENNRLSPLDRALYHHTQALLAERKDNRSLALSHYKQAYTLNPYHRATYEQLANAYRETDNTKEIEKLEMEDKALYRP